MVMIGQTTTDDGDTVIITGHIIMTSHNSQTKKFGYIGIIPLTNVGTLHTPHFTLHFPLHTPHSTLYT